jgi:hypothetical protein
MLNHKSTYTLLFKKLTLLAMLFIATLNINAQQNKIEIEGVLQDVNEMTIPYAAVSIPTKNIGTTSTEDGQFYLSLKQSNLQDSLVISSMGFKSYKIKIEDYLKQKINKIVLEDDVTALATVQIMDAEEFIVNALKQTKNTFISDSHQLDLVYRRTNVEQNVSKFFVEHYMSISYKGPKSYIAKMQVNQSRKSADYRIVKKPQWNHAAVYMMDLNPLKDYYTPLKKMDWKKIGDSTYDGEDVLIFEGTKENVDKVGKIMTTILYIGYETNNIYKVESSVGKSVYQYVKNSEGKLYLSYHKREYTGQNKISHLEQKLLKLKSPYISHAYRHEAIVLEVITDKKKFTAKGYEEFDKDLSKIELPYNPEFWSNLSLPPDSDFYKKIKRELESNYGVPLETQFKYVN